MEQGAPMTGEQTNKRGIQNWIEHVDENQKSLWIGKYCVLFSTVFKYTNQPSDDVCRIKPTSLNGSLFKKLTKIALVLHLMCYYCCVWSDIINLSQLQFLYIIFSNLNISRTNIDICKR